MVIHCVLLLEESVSFSNAVRHSVCEYCFHFYICGALQKAACLWFDQYNLAVMLYFVEGVF